MVKPVKRSSVSQDVVKQIGAKRKNPSLLSKAGSIAKRAAVGVLKETIYFVVAKQIVDGVKKISAASDEKRSKKDAKNPAIEIQKQVIANNLKEQEEKSWQQAIEEGDKKVLWVESVRAAHEAKKSLTTPKKSLSTPVYQAQEKPNTTLAKDADGKLVPPPLLSVNSSFAADIINVSLRAHDKTHNAARFYRYRADVYEDSIKERADFLLSKKVTDKKLVESFSTVVSNIYLIGTEGTDVDLMVKSSLLRAGLNENETNNVSKLVHEFMPRIIALENKSKLLEKQNTLIDLSFASDSRKNRRLVDRTVRHKSLPEPLHPEQVILRQARSSSILTPPESLKTPKTWVGLVSTQSPASVDFKITQGFVAPKSALNTSPTGGRKFADIVGDSRYSGSLSQVVA